MAQEALNQAAWGFIQDWLQKRNAQLSLESMLKQQEGWSKYQQEGALLETQRLADALQADKERMFNSSMLKALLDMGDPESIRSLELLSAFQPFKGAIPEELMSRVPAMRERSEHLAAGLGPLLEGQTSVPGVDVVSMIQAMGGMPNYLRAAETGKGRVSLQEQLPSQRANAYANLLNQLGGDKAAGRYDNDTINRIHAWAKETKNDVDAIFRKWLPSGGTTGATADMVLGLVSEMMGKAPEDPTAQKDARQWINEVGIEFFDELSGLIQEVLSRSTTGSSTSVDVQILTDAGSPYWLGKKFGKEKEDMLQALEKRFAGTKVANVRERYESDPDFRREVLNNIWTMIYGGK